jgi:MFS family permease
VLFRSLAQSRATVMRLAALFSIDAFGGGFAIQSLLALWLLRRFNLSLQAAGTFFFVAGLLGSFSQFISSRLATRFGRINTMVYTHLPSNAFLILAALMPTATLAIVFLLLRASMSSMDIPARQSYVMAVVPPEERSAAAGVTGIARTIGSSVAPLAAGPLFAVPALASVPFFLAGGLKILYDLLLWRDFRRVKPEEERVP